MTEPTALTREYLRKIAKKTLELFDEMEISSYTDIDRVLNHESPIDENTGEHITFQLRPSNFGTQAYTISYITPGQGIPLEIKINKEIGYSKVIVKGEFVLSDYRPFAIDGMHVAREKNFDSTEISILSSELKRLANY